MGVTASATFISTSSVANVMLSLSALKRTGALKKDQYFPAHDGRGVGSNLTSTGFESSFPKFDPASGHDICHWKIHSGRMFQGVGYGKR